jgi:hypothetical protein
MDGHVPSELHGKWVDPVNATRLKPCGLNGSQKGSNGIYFLPDGTGMVQGAYGHPGAAGHRAVTRQWWRQ